MGTRLRVHVVGSNSEKNKNYWLVKNSNGSSWGEEGYIKMLCSRKTSVVPPLKILIRLFDFSNIFDCLYCVQIQVLKSVFHIFFHKLFFYIAVNCEYSFIFYDKISSFIFLSKLLRKTYLNIKLYWPINQCIDIML